MRNYTFYTFILSGLLIVAGLVCALTLTTKITLTCVRGMDNKCVLSSVGKFRSTSQEIKLSDITSAKVEIDTWTAQRPYRQTNVRRSSYVVALITKNGLIPLTESSPYRNKDMPRMVKQINTFLRNRGQASFQLVKTDNGLGITVGVLCAIIGFMLGRFSLRSQDS